MLIEKLRGSALSLTWATVLFFVLGSTHSFAGASIWMVRETGALQCEEFDLKAAELSAKKELKLQGVKWKRWEHQPSGLPGVARIQVCGSPTGGRFRVKVKASDRKAAEKANFKVE